MKTDTTIVCLCGQKFFQGQCPDAREHNRLIRLVMDDLGHGMDDFSQGSDDDFVERDEKNFWD